MKRDRKRDSTITLGPNESAFVVREGGKQEIYIPSKTGSPASEVMLKIVFALDDKDIMLKVEKYIMEMFLSYG